VDKLTTDMETTRCIRIPFRYDELVETTSQFNVGFHQ